MTSYPRTRSRNRASVGNGYSLVQGYTSSSTSPPDLSGATVATEAFTLQDVISDWVSDSLPWPDHPLTSHQWVKSNPVLAHGDRMARNAFWTPPRYARDYSNAVRLLPWRQSEISHLQPVILPNWTDLINQSLQRFDPNQPDLDVPAFVVETLLSAPQMLKHAGDVLRGRFGPGDYVAWQFGWKLLLQDLRTLLNFQQAVDRRMDLLQSERAPSSQYIGLGRIEKTQSLTIERRGAVSIRGEATTVLDQWAVFTHGLILDSLPSFPSRDQAAGLAFNVSIDAATLWELFPWSWLIDWFVDVGTFLSLSRNRVPYSVRNLNIMVTTETEQRLTFLRWWTTSVSAKHVIYDNNNFDSAINQTVKSRTKQRAVYPDPRPGVAIHLPFLTSRQWGILGSISTSRYRL